MKPIADQYLFVDSLMGKALAKPGAEHCCSKGCFHCCREPVFASRAQVKYLLETYPPEQLEFLKGRVQFWLDRFMNTNFKDEHKPNAFRYRERYLWCPLLTMEGTCSVYERRPLECRWFFAQGDPRKCADDALRPEQKFLDAPQIVDAVMTDALRSMENGERIEYDHLGAMLAEELLGVTVETMARTVFQRSGDEILIIRHENNVDTKRATP